MAIRYYDEAIATKINSWLPKNNNRQIKVLKPEETKRLFEIEADEKNDGAISLPLIALSRDSSIDMIYRGMNPMSYDGLLLDSDGDSSIKLRGIPITLTYQLDIYTKRYDEGDEILREFVFKLMNKPQIVIELPYNNQHFKHVASIQLQGQIEDTSDIQQRLFSGQFTRWTIRFGIIGAYLFSIPIVNNVKIEGVELDVAQNKEHPLDFEMEEVFTKDENN